MIHPQALCKLFCYNFALIQEQIQDVTHEQSLVAPPFGGNCINWLVGHIISSRMRALSLIGKPVFWSDAQRAPYRSGSAAITATTVGIIPFSQLFHDLNQSQQYLLNGLEQLQYDDLCQPSGYQDNTIGDSLAYYHFHEAHHAGQIVYLAPLLGVPSAWLPD
jgi:hypothetical protein